MSRLSELLAPESGPVGYTHGWGEWARAQLASASVGMIEPVALDGVAVTHLLTCEGRWQAERTAGDAMDPVRIVDELARLLVSFWLSSRVQGRILSPSILAGMVAGKIAAQYEDAAPWLASLTPEQQAGLRARATVMFGGLDRDWLDCPGPDDVEVPQEAARAEAGRLTLTADDLDAVVGHGEVDDEVVWAGRTLVGFTTGPVSRERVDQLGLAALVHAMSTGQPPRRLVLWNVIERSGAGLDVDPVRLDDWLDRVLKATQKAAALQTGKPTLSPGTHCGSCLNLATCVAADRGKDTRK